MQENTNISDLYKMIAKYKTMAMQYKAENQSLIEINSINKNVLHNFINSNEKEKNKQAQEIERKNAKIQELQQKLKQLDNWVKVDFPEDEIIQSHSSQKNLEISGESHSSFYEIDS